jgi:hypothetical protein
MACNNAATRNDKHTYTLVPLAVNGKEARGNLTRALTEKGEKGYKIITR